MRIFTAFLLFSFVLPAVAKFQIQSTSEGDFVISGDQWIDAAFFSDGTVGTLGAKPSEVRVWPEGVLPVVFTRDVPKALRNTVAKACQEWATYAKVRCVNGPYKGRRLVISTSYLGSGKGCWAMLGSDYYFMGIRRRMNLGKGCEKYATVLHELGHAFGLTHEHQRTDRDNFVKVFSENVDGQFLNFGLKLNFEAQKGSNLSFYDFHSIMHYGPHAFSKNGKPTLLPLKKYSGFTDVIGKAQGLSVGDIISIQKLYGVRKP